MSGALHFGLLPRAAARAQRAAAEFGVCGSAAAAPGVQSSEHLQPRLRPWHPALLLTAASRGLPLLGRPLGPLHRPGPVQHDLCVAGLHEVFREKDGPAFVPECLLRLGLLRLPHGVFLKHLCAELSERAKEQLCKNIESA